MSRYIFSPCTIEIDFAGTFVPYIGIEIPGCDEDLSEQGLMRVEGMTPDELAHIERWIVITPDAEGFLDIPVEATQPKPRGPRCAKCRAPFVPHVFGVESGVCGRCGSGSHPKG